MIESVEAQRTTLFGALFQGYDGPAFAIRLWDGWHWFSSGEEKPVCTVVLRHSTIFASFIAEPNEITLGEAFIQDDIDIEGDIFSAFSIAEHILNRPRSRRQQILEKIAGTFFGLNQWFRHGARHSRRRDRASISHHYDQPVEFYEPWLGNSLAYSCAYFRDEQDPIDDAQEQKLELICQKLRLQPREQFLDIGCGWGSLILHAASKHRVFAQGITISQEQAEVAKLRIERARLNQSCAVELQDYRELEKIDKLFDKVASVGMFEHVGLKNLPQYFKIVQRILKPGGVFLNHGIARSYSSPTRKNSFIDRYVFPDGELVPLCEALEAAESQGLEVRDVENLREHYELTLRRWVEGLRQNVDTVLRHVPEVAYRVWLLYMAGSAAAFRRGDIGVYQVLLSRPDRGASYLPLTREDWYSSSSCPKKVEV